MTPPSAGLAGAAGPPECDIPADMTLCSVHTQAILAAEAGATHSSPFLGRIGEIRNDGVNLLSGIVDICRTQGYRTLVLAASSRSPQHVEGAAKAGGDLGTEPALMFRAHVTYPLTDIEPKRFPGGTGGIPTNARELNKRPRGR